ncbi:uncharacterized protein ndufv3 [Leucoraja erinacea]|uniref:uncharacterized protein ndufv3 n=1 Tax=Leucoraja erinaceus TaxID=7782 RepID=UPI0024590B3E|nr:uncharacterized protein ndufv3 [Leucoraja erinacea]
MLQSQMLFLGRLELQGKAFTTKTPGPQKKKKVKGPRAQDLSHGISLVRATDMTARERAKLLTTKTLLHFPGKSPGPPQAALSLSGQKEASSRPGPQHGLTQTMAARHPGITQVSVGAESDSSSSSDSDEETVSGNAQKRPVRFLRHNSPAGSADWSKERKQVEQRAWASQPQTHLGIAVSSSSDTQSPSQPSGLDEKQVAQVARPEASGQRNAPEVAAAPVSATSMDQDSGFGKSRNTDVLLAQRGTQEQVVEEDVAADEETSPLDQAADTSPEPVKEPADEVLDNSTYKNIQHHDYTPLTFVDLDMEMAKYRLPQPSSGRLTPRD